MSSKVIDLGVNQKPICDFLLVINSNFGRILHRFRDIAAQMSKIRTIAYILSRVKTVKLHIAIAAVRTLLRCKVASHLNAFWVIRFHYVA